VWVVPVDSRGDEGGGKEKGKEERDDKININGRDKTLRPLQL